MISSNDIPKELTKEIELIYRITYKNIIRIYGIYNDPVQDLYKFGIVMDYYRNGDLYDLITKHNSVLRNTIYFIRSFKTYITLNICEGIKFLHENNVIHRDIKPDNVLLEIDRESLKDSRLVLIDYGFPKHALIDSSPKTFVGTMLYMPPKYIRLVYLLYRYLKN